MPALPPHASRSFPPEPASVPAARRFVRGLLEQTGSEQWTDEAQLAVSELATNAVLHAHTAFEVAVQAGPDGVHVQVWDDDPFPPTRRSSGAEATTGRGLELVEAVAAEYGVQVVGPSKVVWFCLGTTRPIGATDVLLDRWQDRTGEDEAPAGEASRVVLRAMPLALWLSAREHHNTLMREFALYEQTHLYERHLHEQAHLYEETQPAAGGVSPALVAADRARSLVLAALRRLEVAAQVDVVLAVRPEQAAWFEALRDVLDGAELLARSGELLATPGPPEIVRVRRWACDQVLGQLAGGRPLPWSGPLALGADGSRTLPTWTVGATGRAG